MRIVIGAAVAALSLAITAGSAGATDLTSGGPGGFATGVNALRQVHEGRKTFRFDTFGDEAFWGDTLKLHQAIEGAPTGGVGPGVSPATALAVGLKVDVDALPADAAARSSKRGTVDLDDPATTLALLQAERRRRRDRLLRQSTASSQSIGIQCALCHSTVDDSFAPGIGHRLDGWANRDLNVGAIVALAPNLQPVADLLGIDDATVRKVLQPGDRASSTPSCSWTARRSVPTARPAATLIPPAFGLAGVNLHTWTGWGSVHATGTRSSPIWRCTARARSTIRGWTMRRSSRSPRANGFGTRAQRRRI